VRIWSTDTGNDIKNVAFRNPDGGSIVLILVNGKTVPHEVSVQQGGLDFRYTMPAESVATFVWQPGAVAAKPATAATITPPATPGSAGGSGPTPR